MRNDYERTANAKGVSLAVGEGEGLKILFGLFSRKGEDNDT